MPKQGYTSIIVEVYDSGQTSGKHGTRHIRPALLDLAEHTLTAIKSLGAEDYIDVQSFIYVVGGYTEQDRPALRKPPFSQTPFPSLVTTNKTVVA